MTTNTLQKAAVVFAIVLATTAKYSDAFQPRKHILATPSVTRTELCRSRVIRRMDERMDKECPIDGDEGDDELFACMAEAGYNEIKDSKKDMFSHAMISKVFVAEIESLRDKFESFEDEDDGGSNVIRFNKRRVRGSHLHSMQKADDDTDTHVANLEYNRLTENDDLVLVDTTRQRGMQSVSRAFIRAGPRKVLHFNPENVNAAVVTCGGLCPGLNTVIRELVHSLYYLYGANKVYGITGGFHGFHSDKPEFEPVLLTNQLVENIHHEGGTILKSARGGLDIEKTLQFLRDKDIQQLYIIGGDGTHRAAYKIHQACIESNMNVAVAGIPKTIDNDIDYIDRSFGFLSAVEAAQASIRSAKTEAMCFIPNAVGVIKLMGRSAGFLAAFAALGSGDVDAVVVPEVSLVLDGPDGLLPFIRKRVKEQQYAVVVIAEGAGEEILGRSTQTDAGGNRKLPEIGEFVRDEIKEYFAKFDETASVKYIDPSYTVRSVPSNAADTLYCMQLAQNAVHGAMAGFTGFSTGLVNNRVVYLPIPQLVATSPRSLDPHGQTWERILAMTGQPNTADYVYTNGSTTPKKMTEEEKKQQRVEASQDDDQFPHLPEPTLH